MLKKNMEKWKNQVRVVVLWVSKEDSKKELI
jgi:hypothetical protein